MPGKTIKTVWIAGLLLILVAVAAQTGEYTVEEDIVYGHAEDKDLVLDLARPKGDGPFPMIVYIHGGGWFQGDRKVYRGEIEEAAKRGYVAASISYRLMKFDMDKKETTTAMPTYPAQVYDVKAAIRWARASATKYHIDPDRIGVTGASAGGYLSLMLGMTDATDKLEGDCGNPIQSSRVQAVVNVFGPTEMATCYEKSVVKWICRLFLNGTPVEVPERYKAASPINYVTNDDPPVLTLHGDQDDLVNIEQARMLDAKMKAVGVSHTLLELKGQGHGFDANTQKITSKATWDFFDRYLKPAPATSR